MPRPAGKRRADAALQLALAGTNHDDIARTLGYRNGHFVQQVIEQALAVGLDQKTREQQREIAGMRLERLLRSVWPKANDPNHAEHLQAVRAARELIDRHARLYGLDEPTEVVLKKPSDAELVNWVRGVLAYIPNPVDEANVIEAEVVEEVTSG